MIEFIEQTTERYQWTGDPGGLLQHIGKVNATKWRGHAAGTMQFKLDGARGPDGQWTLTARVCGPVLIWADATADRIYGAVEFADIIPADAAQLPATK